MDTGAFLVAFAVFELSLIERPRAFIRMDGGAPYRSRTDQIIAEGDREKQRSQVRRSALEWFHEMGCLTTEDLEVFDRARTLRNRVAHESYGPIVEDLTKALWTSTADLGRLMARMDYWWVREIEDSINPDELGPPTQESDVRSMASVILDHVLRCLTQSEPDAGAEAG